ncbi:hypothetical protein BC629DRAFT_380424 [Irpex lacteus]|nr:hypothetical protein BC629DRAFT_380424 [Irpex lacteus]
MSDSPPPSKKRKGTAKGKSRSKTEGFRAFYHVDEATASRAAPYKPPPEVSKIYLNYLHLDEHQRKSIVDIYADGKNLSQKFDVKSEQDQLTASALLATNQLDFDQLEALQNKWSCRWSKNDGKGKGNTHRVLYQW